MQNRFSKIKKYGFYGLAIVGALTFVLIILQGFKVSYFRVGDYELQEGPLRSKSMSVPTLFKEAELTLPALPPQSVQAQEGEFTQRKIVKNGSLSLLIKRVEDAVRDIKSIAEKFDGFVSESQIYESFTDVKSGSVIIRVPAERFDEAISEIKQLAVKVERERVSATDVTEQFIDLEAQIRNLKTEEAQYLTVMTQAKTVEDTLKVAQQLSNVRGRIEQIEGKLKFLSRQVDMSIIEVSLTAEAEVEVFGIRWRPLFVIKQSLRNMFSGLASFADLMIAFIFYLPVLILWFIVIVFIFAVIWRLFRWIRRKLFTPSIEKNI